VPVPLPEPVRAIVDRPSFVHLATVNGDGSPHVTTMWVGREGDHLIFNTAAGRRKWHNLRRDPRVSVAGYATDEPYRTFAVEGRVVAMTREGGDDGIDELARKYLGLDEYPWRTPEEMRVRIVVAADRVV
jgi:PPOX class probable F420-dependent enzyme